MYEVRTIDGEIVISKKDVEQINFALHEGNKLVKLESGSFINPANVCIIYLMGK